MPPASISDDPTRATRLARLRGLHQYYRDALSSNFAFPDLGDVPRELAEWVVRTDNVDTLQLAELLQQIPNTALPAGHDRALRLMLFAILQANACTDANNRYRDHIVPERLADSMRGALGRILGLHRCYEYFIDAVQLLYRMNLLEDVDAFMADHPDLFAGDATLRAIAGFIETGCGNYAAGLAHLDPLVAGPGREGLPLVAALSHMTCAYRLGALPDWPLRFDALAAGPDRFARELALLPELRMLQPLPEGAGPVVFVACDDGYFAEHARHLACSLHAANGSPPALHLHLYSPGAATLAVIDTLRARLPGLAIGVSAEDARCRSRMRRPTMRPRASFAPTRCSSATGATCASSTPTRCFTDPGSGWRSSPVRRPRWCWRRPAWRRGFTAQIDGYGLGDYPPDYDPANPPHPDTPEAAAAWCAEHGGAGVTCRDGRFEVRSGPYLVKEAGAASWAYL